MDPPFLQAHKPALSLQRTPSTMMTTRALFLIAVGLLCAQTAAETFDVEFLVNLGPGKQDKFVVEVRPDWAPLGATRFKEMVEADFFKGNRFFRVMEDFIAQFGIAGNPSQASKWGQMQDDEGKVTAVKGTLAFAAKLSKDGEKYGPLTGTPEAKEMHKVAMVRVAGEHSRATQMFINLKDNGHFNQFGLVPFARVKPGGMSVVEQLYKEYGETAAGKGTGKGPDQVRIIKEGNKYLKTEFPNLSYIISARILGKQDL